MKSLTLVQGATAPRCLVVAMGLVVFISHERGER